MEPMISLNGVEVKNVVPEIILNAVSIDRPEIKANFSDRAYFGRFKNSIRRSHITVTVEAQFRAINKPELRADCIDRLNAWAAQGGVLTLSTRPGKRLNVLNTRLASEGAAHKSDEVAVVEFQTAENPYWESEQLDTAVIELTRDMAQTQIEIQGTTETMLSASITVGNAPLTFMGIRTGDTHLDFMSPQTVLEDGSVAVTPFAEAGSRIEIGYVNDYLRFTVNGESLFAYRTSDSSDELVVMPGENLISIAADGALTAGFSARGRWI